MFQTPDVYGVTSYTREIHAKGLCSYKSTQFNDGTKTLFIKKYFEKYENNYRNNEENGDTPPDNPMGLLIKYFSYPVTS